MANISWTRRRCVLTLGLGAFAVAAPRAPWARAATPAERWVELKNVHTSEVATAQFNCTIGPDAGTCAKFQHLLRDYRVNEEHPMDADLYGLLTELADAAGCDARYEVISGYRSPRTNAGLRAAGHGVAEHSLHMEGKAIDVRLHGCDCATLRDLALKVGRGGVGYYPSSNFVHLDTGRVRAWLGR